MTYPWSEVTGEEGSRLHGREMGISLHLDSMIQSRGRQLGGERSRKVARVCNQADEEVCWTEPSLLDMTGSDGC